MLLWMQFDVFLIQCFDDVFNINSILTEAKWMNKISIAIFGQISTNYTSACAYFSVIIIFRHTLITNGSSQKYLILINEPNFCLGDGNQNGIGYQRAYKLGKALHNFDGFRWNEYIFVCNSCWISESVH